MRARLVGVAVLLLGWGCGGGSPGTYRVWVQAFSSSAERSMIPVEVGIWAPYCGAPR
jgi:hypothetical protein